MRIGRKVKGLFCKQLIDNLPNKSNTSQFYSNNEINYNLLQKHLIESHIQAFNYYWLLLEKALEAGCRDSLETANKVLLLHSRQIAAISGITYFADINAAAARLERAGYSISDESST